MGVTSGSGMDRLDRHQQICDTERFWRLEGSDSRPGCRGGELGQEATRSLHDTTPRSTGATGEDAVVEDWIIELAES